MFKLKLFLHSDELLIKSFIVCEYSGYSPRQCLLVYNYKISGPL